MARPNPVCPQLFTDTEKAMFWARVLIAEPQECWFWFGYHSSVGYGSFRGPNGTVYPHRVAWALTHGEIPEGMTLDHLCKNKRCCNPAHLEPVPQSINIKRYFAVRADELGVCKCGQPRHSPRKRLCLACAAAYQREYRVRNYKRVHAHELASQAKRRGK